MIVMVAQTKGGVGKSMIAANLAAMVASKGKTVLLVDADRQQTCSKWSSTRIIGGITPDVRVVCLQIDANTTAKEFSASLGKLQERYDEVVVDCGGQDSKELRASLMKADVLVAPCRPTQSDIWGLDDLDKLVISVNQIRSETPISALVVLNMTDPLNIHGAKEDALSAIGELKGVQYSGCAVMNRPTFNSAFQSGRAVSDLDISHEPSRKATAEIKAIFNCVYEGVA